MFITRWQGLPTMEEAAEFFGEYRAVLERLQPGEKVVVITDFTNAERPGPDIRKFVGESFRNLGDLRKHVVNSYLVVSSAMVRGAVTAASWIAPSMKTITMVATFDDAMNKAKADLDAL